MKTRTTLILLLLTTGLASWLLLRDRQVKPDGQLLFDFSARTLDLQTPTVDINGAQVAAVELQSSTSHISLQRGADLRWELNAPIKDRADEATVKQLVEYTSLARVREIIDNGELKSGKVTAAGLGLDDANSWRVSWLAADGSKLSEVRVGKSAPLAGTTYLQVDSRKERPDIYLVEPDLRLLLARPADAFRDTRVSRYTSEEVHKIVVRKGEGEVEFSRTSAKPGMDAPWVISRPLSGAPANQPAAKDFVAMICGAKLEGWVPWTEAPAGDKPVVEVTLFPAGEGAKGATLSFYEDAAPEKKFAICRDPQRKAAFKVDRQIMLDLCLAESPNDFREIKLATIEPGFISTVRVEHVEGDSVELVRVGDRWSWRPLSGGKWSVAAPEAIDKLIRQVNETDITEFVSDSLADPAQYSLAKPAIQLTFAKGAHLGEERLTPVTKESSQVLRIGIHEDGRIFANFAGEPFVYRIGPELPGGIPRSGIKWRSLLLSSFNLLQIKTLRQIIGAAPPLEMTRVPPALEWASVQQAGVDVSSRLLKAEAESVAAKLGALSATTWLGDSAEARTALETRALRMEATFDAYDEKDPNKTVEKTFSVDFAPTGGPFCYCRMGDTQEYFLIDKAIFLELSRNLIGK